MPYFFIRCYIVVKKSFKQFATNSGFDPRVADNWVNVPTSDLLRSIPVCTNFLLCLFSSLLLIVSQDAQNVLYYYGSFFKALVDLFPTVAFDKGKFSESSCMLFPFCDYICSIVQ